MSNTFESDRSDARGPLRMPRSRERLLDTPLRDLIRGRVTGRLNWRNRIMAASLPPTIAALLVRTVRFTRLWRIEKVEVADELIAHFADGIASGISVERLVREFGDERVAARLIRRAKRRNRSFAWRTFKWTRRAVALLILFYAVMLLRFVVGTPTIRVDYLARLNAAAEQIPIADRAWPIYQHAIHALEFDGPNVGGNTLYAQIDERAQSPLDVQFLIDASPGDVCWAALTAWLDTHRSGIDLLRVAAAKPTMGYQLQRGALQNDAELSALRRLQSPLDSSALIDVMFPMRLLVTHNHKNILPEVLAADCRYARAQGDGARFVANLTAILQMSRHHLGSNVVDSGATMGIVHVALDQLEFLLAEQPTLLSDAQLANFLHQLAAVGGDAPASLISVEGDRNAFYDVVQHVYTDDGDGNGHLIREASRPASVRLAMTSGIASNAAYAPPFEELAQDFAVASALSIVSSRRDVVAEFDRLVDEQMAATARPLRESTASDNAFNRTTQRLQQIGQEPMLMVCYLPVSMFTPWLGGAAMRAEQTLGRREGLCIGIALELYRRRHDGIYPESLAALAPSLLPRLPVDRINGGPLHYRLIDGKPVIYSVGDDLDDDGGRLPVDEHFHRPNIELAATWNIRRLSDTTPADGDWVIYDAANPCETAFATRVPEKKRQAATTRPIAP